MPNNPNNARSLLNLVKAPTQATPAPQAAAPTLPTLSAEEERVQKAYDALGISPPIGTPQNPVKMAAGGGVLGDIGLLNAVRMGIKPRLTPEQQAYMDQYNTYTEKYNTEFLPAYEAIAPQREAWEAEYNKVVADINAGKYDKTFNLRSDSSKGWQEYYAALNAGYENIQYGPDIVRPKTANVIYKTPEPVLTVAEPVMPTVNAEGYAPTEGERYLEDVSLAAQQSAKRRNLGLAAFSNPQGYNLAGFGGAATFKDGGEVDKEEAEATSEDDAISRKNLLDMLIEKQALQNLIAEMPAVRVDPTLIAGTFEDKNAKGNYYDVGADISLGDKVGLGASGRGTSVKFDGGGFKENVLSQLRGSYTTDDGIRYAAEYSPVGNPGQLDPSQRAFRLSRRNLNDQSEISLSREPGRMGFEAPGQAPEPGTTDTTWLRYAKEFAEGGAVKKSDSPIDFIKQNVQSLGLDPAEGAYNMWKENVPSHIRIASQTILGDRTKPFTNKDFTEKELAAYVDVIKEAEKRALEEAPQILSDNARMLKNIEKRISLNENPQDPEYIKDLLRQKERIEKHTARTQQRLDKYKQGKGDIQYADYNVYKSDNLADTPNSKEGINLANTIGRFSYEKTPTGEIAVKDRWDFDNELDQGYASKYEKLSPAPRAVELAKDLFKPGMDAKTALTLSAMAVLGKSKGRDIDLKLPIKKKNGGDVKAPSKLDPVYVETASLRKQIEDSLPKDKYFETYPVSSVYLMENAQNNEGGVTYPYKNKYSMEINPKGNFKDKYGTFEHERQHLIDAKRGKTELRYPAPEYIPEDAKYNKPTVPVDKELQFKTKNDIYSAFQKYRKELGLSADFVEEGFFAEIRSIEKGLPAGKSILDTNIGKDLFANNPELLQTYWSRTRPEFTTYMTEQRDSPRYKMNKRTDGYKEQPKTEEKGTLTKVQDFIRSKTNN